MVLWLFQRIFLFVMPWYMHLPMIGYRADESTCQDTTGGWTCGCLLVCDVRNSLSLANVRGSGVDIVL